MCTRAVVLVFYWHYISDINCLCRTSSKPFKTLKNENFLAADFKLLPIPQALPFFFVSWYYHLCININNVEKCPCKKQIFLFISCSLLFPKRNDFHSILNCSIDKVICVNERMNEWVSVWIFFFSILAYRDVLLHCVHCKNCNLASCFFLVTLFMTLYFINLLFSFFPPIFDYHLDFCVFLHFFLFLFCFIF